MRILTQDDIKHIDGPIGLQNRFTSNELIKSLGWYPKIPIEAGLCMTYEWIKEQMT